MHTDYQRLSYSYDNLLLAVLARFFGLSSKIFKFIGPLRGWKQENLTFETPKASKMSIFRGCQPLRGPINPKIETRLPLKLSHKSKVFKKIFC